MTSSLKEPEKKQRILVIGGGAVGAFYASRLPSCDVSVVCRSNYRAVLESGFTVESRDFGSYVFKPSAVYPSISAAGHTSPDYILIATKATEEPLGLGNLYSPSQGRTPVIVLIQNGIAIEQGYASKCPSSLLLSGVTAISAAQPSPGKIVQHRWTRLQLGQFPSDTPEGFQAAQTLAFLFQAGGIKDALAYHAVDLQLLRWHKLAINASFSPSAVLSGGFGNAELASHPKSASHIQSVMEEVLETGKRICQRGYPSECASIQAILESTKRNLGAKPSMLMDWESGHPLEIEPILGNPIREAHKHGLSMPRLEVMYALLSMQLHARQEKREASKL